MKKKKVTAADIVSAVRNLQRQDPNRDANGIIEEVAITFRKNSSDVKRMVVRFAILKNRAPGKLYDLDANCFILLDGRQISSCRELTKGVTRHSKPWLNIERRCLLCSMQNHKGADAVTEVANDLAAYFDRTPEAIAAEYYRLINKK